MERKGLSELGLSSLIIYIFTVLGVFITFLIAGYFESTSAGWLDEESTEAIFIGLFIIGFGFIAMGLGIAGIFQKIRDRITAIIGTSISSATLIITISLMVL